MAGIPLDGLVARLLASSSFTYQLAADDAERRCAYRLRGQTVVERGWMTVDQLHAGEEHDEYDVHALHVVGYDVDLAMCTGRVVLPPGLPTEDACGLVVEPVGQVVDVGRMCVASSHQNREHAAFVGLMCALYAHMRNAGYSVACGMMSPAAQALVRQFGLTVETLGRPRSYWNERRTPVRFDLMLNAEVATSPITQRADRPATGA